MAALFLLIELIFLMFRDHYPRFGASLEIRVYWVLGSGRSTSFLNYVWISELGPLVNHSKLNATLSLDLKVADLVGNFGEWKWFDLCCFFNRETLEVIRVSCPPNDLFGEDFCRWYLDTRGKFSVKATYNSLALSNDVREDHD